MTALDPWIIPYRLTGFQTVNAAFGLAKQWRLFSLMYPKKFHTSGNFAKLENMTDDLVELINVMRTVKLA